MAKELVNTERIMSSANKLRNVNNNIDSAFSSMKKKAKNIETNWKGSAADMAKTTMYKLFNDSDARSKVLQNYVNLLEQQVNPGYINAENTNVSLADKFK